MKGKVIQAEVRPMSVISLQIPFAVHIIAPIEMPPQIYKIDYQDVIVRVGSARNEKRVIYDILTERVLADYNRFIEDCPIMDMFADPIKYEQCSYIEWIFVSNLEEKFAKLV